MNNGNIDIDLGSLDQAINQMNQIMDNMAAFISIANQASNNVLQAFGNNTTVANALRSQIVTVNEEDFKEAQKNLATIEQDINTAKQTYRSEEEDWLSVINKYRA